MKKAMRLLSISLIPALLFCTAVAGAQASENDFRSTLNSYLSAIRRDAYGLASDSINLALEDVLMNAGVTHPEMMKWDFKGLDTAGLTVLTSTDRKFRIYCWDNRNGGTMHFYTTLLQYETAPGKTVMRSLRDTAESDRDAGSNHHRLRTVGLRSGRNVYLAFYHSVLSSVDKVDGVRAYAIDSGLLREDYPVFRTKKTRIGDIWYAYNLHDAGFFENRYLPQITLSWDGKTLSVPVIGDADRFTRRKLIYRLEGDQFVFRK